MRLLALVALVTACGGARPNKLYGPRYKLSAIHPPHEPIYVKTPRGVVRMP